MKKVELLFVSLIIFSMVFSQFYVVDAWSDRSYDELISAFMNLANQHPSLVSYESIGTTVENREIIMFKIGNPQALKILFDGSIHGWETVTSEVLYLYSNWLVSSNDEIAKDIRDNTCTLIIPALNVDGYNEKRKNSNDVDLNRNFESGWEHAGSTDPSSEYYRGSYPLSEPESNALIEVFLKYKPKIYANLHEGGTYYAGARPGESAEYQEIVEKVKDFAEEEHIDPYYYQGEFGGSGMAIADAAQKGIMSFIFELDDPHTSFDISTDIYPRFWVSAVVLSQELFSTSETPSTPTIPSNGGTTFVDLVAPVTSCYYDGLWHTNTVNLTLTATDNYSGVAQTYYKINNGTTKTVDKDGQPIIFTESANNTLEYWSVDNFGNTEISKELTEIKLDNSSPNSSITIKGKMGTDEWFTSEVNVTISTKDLGSGVNLTEYSFNEILWNNYTNPFIINNEQIHKIYYRAKDNVGNIETTKVKIVKIDKTAPTIDIISNLTNIEVNPSEEATVAIISLDNVSEIKNITFSYTTNNQSWLHLPLDFNTKNNTYETKIPPQSEGTILTFEIDAQDYAGNLKIKNDAINYNRATIPEFPFKMIFTIFLIMVLVFFMKKRFLNNNEQMS